ncbi:MAG: hypothetical protein ACI9F9_001078 [Candidatus Paceibacteria bacterium]|jgi:hypothetical protein
MRCTHLAVAALLAAFSSTAQAQGFNVDIDDPFGGLPPTSAAYAAAGTAGTWNQVDPNTGSVFPLVDKAGVPSAVSLNLTSTLNLTLTAGNPVFTGDDRNLMDDLAYGGIVESMTFAGLANGVYDVYTYAMASDTKVGFITDVDVSESTDGVQAVGGFLWPGNHQQGVSYAKHTATVTAGTLRITISVNSGDLSLNGIQIEPSGNPGLAYCFGDGSGAACPCAAFGAAGAGCLTTVGTGATLTGTGNPDVGSDSFALTVTGGPANKPGLFFQGSNMVNVPAGDGILCSNATLRYGVQSLDANGMVTQSGFGLNAAPGQTLNYQYWFRDPANPCTGSGFNFTGGWVTTWQ